MILEKEEKNSVILYRDREIYYALLIYAACLRFLDEFMYFCYKLSFITDVPIKSNTQSEY